MRGALDAFINHRYTDLVVVVLILASVALLVIEVTLPESSPLFDPVETTGHVLTWVFVAELLVRLFAMPNRRRFLRLYWLDVLAVLPVMRSLRILRVVRLLRLFRVGVLLNRRMLGIGDALRRGKSELLTVGTIVLIVVLAGAIGINLAERDAGGVYQTIAGSVWWSLYALVSAEPILGVPDSFLGRLLTLVVMLGGLGFFATFTGIVSAAMVNRLSSRMEVKEMTLADLQDHVVVCGWNRMGAKILDELAADPTLANRAVVLVTELESPPAQIPVPPDRFYFMRGDFTKVEVLQEAGIERASHAILLADKSHPRSDQDRDARTVLAALTIERLNHDIFTCVELLNRDNQSHLAMAGVEEIVVPDEYAGKILATASRNRGIVSMLDELFTTRYGNQIYKAPVPAGWEGKPVRWAHTHLKEEHGATLLSLERPACDETGSCQVLVNPAPEEILQQGDNLILVARRMPEKL